MRTSIVLLQLFLLHATYAMIAFESFTTEKMEHGVENEDQLVLNEDSSVRRRTSGSSSTGWKHLQTVVASTSVLKGGQKGTGLFETVNMNEASETAKWKFHYLAKFSLELLEASNNHLAESSSSETDTFLGIIVPREIFSVPTRVTEIMSLETQKVAGTNYRLCLLGQYDDERPSVHFQITIYYPLGTTPGDDSAPGAALIKCRGLNAGARPFRCSTSGNTFVTDTATPIARPGPSVDASGVTLSEEEHSSTTIAPSLLRFSRSSIAMSVHLPPESFDWRDEMDEACRAQIESVYDQGLCGSCYAVSATGAAADRICIAAAHAGKKMTQVIRLSVQDVLSCGSRKKGNICKKFKGGDFFFEYASGCDGGEPLSVFEYATDYGLVEEECSAYDMVPNKVTTDYDLGLETDCVLHVFRASKAGKIYCDESYVEVEDSDAGVEAIISLSSIFCSCDEEKRKFVIVEKGTRREIHGWPSSMFLIDRVYESENVCVLSKKKSAAWSKSDDWIAAFTCGSVTLQVSSMPKEAQQGTTFHRNMGAVFTVSEDLEDNSLTIAGKICRCVVGDREGSDWDLFEFHEAGKDALRTVCERDMVEPKESCEKKYEFHLPFTISGEEALKRAIMMGGPIASSVYADEELDGLEGEEIYDPPKDSEVNHNIVIFGWGKDEDSNTPFWWARNSWGQNWPASSERPGIFKIARAEDGALELADSYFVSVKRIPIAQDPSAVQNPFASVADAICKNVITSTPTSGDIEAQNCVTVDNSNPSQVTIKNVCNKEVMLGDLTYHIVSETQNEADCEEVYIGEPIGVRAGQTRVLDHLRDLCYATVEFGEVISASMQMALPEDLKDIDPCFEVYIEKNCVVEALSALEKCEALDGVKGKLFQFESDEEDTIELDNEADTTVQIDEKFCDEGKWNMVVKDLQSPDVPLDPSCFRRILEQECFAKNNCDQDVSLSVERISTFSLNFVLSPGDDVPLNPNECHPETAFKTSFLE